MGKRVLLVKAENCKGCHLCELACSSAKKGEFIPAHSRIRVVTKGLKGWSRPIVCLQCEAPMCMTVCSVEAIYKTTTSQGDMIVCIDKKKCIGCYQCVVACPFGAIEYLKDQKATKCDLCGGSPECVDLCFYDCLKFIELSEEDYQERMKKIKFLTTKVCRELSKQELYRRRVKFSLEMSKVMDF
jgi:Fe-S-cluster-containing hydrogenase component 2